MVDLSLMVKTPPVTKISIDKISDLPEENPNQMSLEQYQALVKSIKTHGFLQPIVVYKSGKKFLLCDGFHRRKAMLELGETEIPATVCDDLDQAKIVARVLRLGMNINRGEVPFEQKAREVTDLLELGITEEHLQTTGITDAELEMIKSSINLDLENLFKTPDLGLDVDLTPSDEPSNNRSYKYSVAFDTKADRDRFEKEINTKALNEGQSCAQVLLSFIDG